MKGLYRIICALLCVALIIPTLVTTLFAVAPELGRAAPGAPEELSSLSAHLHASVSTEDNTSHLPVNVHTYYDSEKEYKPSAIGVDGTVSILYVMNTNTDRLGQKSDAELVQSFLDRGYFVIVLDYMNNPLATGTALDWSVQDIRCQVIGGNPFAGGRVYTGGTYTDGKLAGESPVSAKSYIIPAGYDIIYNIPYFSYDKHGVAGSFEYIVEVWNTDFKSVKRNTIVKWVDENGLPRLDRTEAIVDKAPQDTSNVDYAVWFKTADGGNGISQAALESLSESQQKQYQYTYIGNTKVVDVTDCVKPDGSMIDLTLYFDIIYPSDYYEELPAMISMSSAYTRANSWTGETRPYLNGPLFNGYVGIVSDYGLVPMCRNDHYGYFCGDSQLNSVSGDNGTYSLSYYNGIHSDTALLRTIRKIGSEGMDVEGFGFVKAPINPEKIGAYGNSKAGVIIRLANPTPEKLTELRSFVGHMGETRYEVMEGDYPYVDPYVNNGSTTDERIAMPEEQPVLTYNNGEVIHSGLNFVFANCGGASNTLTEGSAPIFGVGTQSGEAEGSYYTFYSSNANIARSLDIPFFGLVAPKIAHDLGYGLDKDYGLDIYESYNRYINYWLKDQNPECIIVDVDTTKDIWVASDVPMDNVYEITEDSSIKLQFTGPIDSFEIQKVKIVSLTDGEELEGDWYGSYGNQQWRFVPYNIKDATYYTVIVPNDIYAQNGKHLKETVTHTFRTASGVTESAVSITAPPVKVASYDCVNRGFSVGAAGYTLDQSVYKFNAFKGEGYGLQLDLRAISASSGINNNQNVRLPIFDEIWADPSYIGSTVTFSFEAMASEAGSIKLALNQHGNGNYVWGDGWGLISADTALTTDWQSFTYQFVVTEELFNARSNSTSSTPDIALGVRFSGFLGQDGKYKAAQINFRNFTTYAQSSNPDLTLSDVNTPLFFNFAQKDYSTANDINLRFAITNDAVNTVGLYKAAGSVLGEKLGEIIVTGTGIYNFDVTEYVKSCDGAPCVAVKIENEVGSAIVNDYNFENNTTGTLGFNAITKAVISNEAINKDGSENNSFKYEYSVPIAQYVDLNNDLVSKYVSSLSSVAYGQNVIKGALFNESDYGRRFRVSFRVFDETSRVVSVHTGYEYSFAESVTDYQGPKFSFYTTPGEWKTVTFEFTVDDALFFGEALNKRQLYIEAENKSIAVLDKYAYVAPNRLVSATSKPGNYAGSPGLNGNYVLYSDVNTAESAGVVDFYDELSYALYIDDIVVEEIATRVELSSVLPTLSITPTTTEDLLPEVSSSVVSSAPDSSQDGLWISGGMEGFDTESVKSYVKLSLENYYGGYAAFLFRARSTGNANVSVYGVLDVASGESWSSKTITSANAPANDIYGSGINMNAVFGNAPLSTFAVGTSESTCLVDLSSYADYMSGKGAKEITLILVSDAKNVTNIEIVGSADNSPIKIVEYDCISSAPGYGAAGFALATGFKTNTNEGIQFDLTKFAANNSVNDNQNVRLSIFDTIWTDSSYIGKTVRFSFSAKSTVAGEIGLTLNQRQKYAFANCPGLNESANLTTEWKTFTYEFTVTQAMYDIITNGDDPNGIEATGLALGIRFSGFKENNLYKAAQLTFRDFIVYELPVNESETVTNIVSYDCVSAAPGYGAAGFALATGFKTNTNEGIQFDLTKFAANNSVNDNQNVRLSIFDTIWTDSSYIGKTVRFSFSAKSTVAGAIGLTLNQRQKYAFANCPGLNESANLTTEWKTFTFEFTVTQEMYDIITNGDDPNGIEATGLALGIRFSGFKENNLYKAAQLTFRNFVVSTVEYHEVEEAETIMTDFDFSSTKPSMTYSGYSGSNLYSISDGALQIYTGNITNGNANQNFRASVFGDVFGNHTENIGKTFRVIFRAKASLAGRLDLSLNSTGGAKNAFTVYPGHSWSFDLTEEYQTFNFTFVAQEGMYDRTQYDDIALGIRVFNGFYGDAAYKDATVYIDNLVVVEDPYIRSVDVLYDFSTNSPTANFSGYSTQVGSVSNGAFEIKPQLSSTCNTGQYARVYGLDRIWENSTNSGKTFTVTFKAKATIAGAMDFSINKDGTFTNYSYGGKTYTQQYNLTTEYQTFSYSFTAIDDMFTTNAVNKLVCAFRFYNGYRDTSTGLYKNVTIHVDDIHVYEELSINKSTLEISDSVAISGSGNKDSLYVYADDSATGAPQIYKSYLSYDLTDVNTVFGAQLNVTLSGTGGEAVKVYILSDTVLSNPLTWTNAPVPTGAAAATFTAANGANCVDISEAIAANVGKNIVIVLTIEEPSEKVEITEAPELVIAKDSHDYTSEAQRHPATSPVYSTPGNVEFYTCYGCDKLYVKNGSEFVEVEAEDVIILPELNFATELTGASLNLGKDLTVRYHVTVGEGKSANDYYVVFTMNDDVVTVEDYTVDEKSGNLIFSFSGIAPQLMGDNIKAELYENGKIIDVKERYSIKEYVVATLRLYPDYSELRQLLCDLLVYGGAAQQYVGYKTDALVTDNVDLSGASTYIPDENDLNREIIGQAGEVKFTAAGVRFDYINRIFVKISAQSLDGVTLTANGMAVELLPTGTSGVYIAYSDAISALSFGDEVTFELSLNDESVQTLVYTVNDYALSKYNDAEIGALALALYRYGKSAEAYDNSL